MSNVAKVDQPSGNVIETNAASVMSMIERAARDPNVDIDKLERLMAMRERLAAKEAEIAFNTALKTAQGEIKPVVKNAKNTQTNSKYATLDAVSEAIDPIATKNGFSQSYGTDTSPLEGHYRIVCDLSHEAGHTRHYQADIPIDATGMKGNANKTATHAFGSTLSYGRRYLKLMIFDVATTDDTDGNRPIVTLEEKFITPEQVRELQDLLIETGSDPAKFLAFAKLPRLEDMYANKFDEAKKLIKQISQRRATS